MEKLNALPEELRPVTRYDISLTEERVWEASSGFWVHASDYDAQSDEVRRLRSALHKYGDHYPECAVIQECGTAVKPSCNCGYDSALGSQP